MPPSPFLFWQVGDGRSPGNSAIWAGKVIPSGRVAFNGVAEVQVTVVHDAEDQPEK